jgi:hypothetical protein
MRAKARSMATCRETRNPTTNSRCKRWVCRATRSGFPAGSIFVSFRLGSAGVTQHSRSFTRHSFIPDARRACTPPQVCRVTQPARLFSNTAPFPPVHQTGCLAPCGGVRTREAARLFNHHARDAIHRGARIVDVRRSFDVCLCFYVSFRP